MEAVANESNAEPKIDFLNFTESWINKASYNERERIKKAPPLLPGDKIKIGEQEYNVRMVNESTLSSEWEAGKEPKIPFLLNLDNPIVNQGRAVAVVSGENVKDSYYVIFGRKEIAKGKYETSFQMIPTGDDAKKSLMEKDVPYDGFLAKLFFGKNGHSLLEDDTHWMESTEVHPIKDLTVVSKTNVPETDLDSFSRFKVTVNERSRMTEAWRKAYKYFPGALLSSMLVGGTVFQFLPTPANEINVPAVVLGNTVGISTVAFAKTLEVLNMELKGIIKKQKEIPGVRKLATLSFENK